MNCEYVRKMYGVPAEIGRRVAYRGRTGVISKDRGNYVGVTFDDERPGTISNFHPTTEGLVYLDEIGTVRPLTRSQRRYRDYVDSEYPGSFPEWLGIA